MSGYKVYVAIDLDTDFYVSWSDYTFTAKQVKNGVVELVTPQFPVGVNGYSKPMYFTFNSRDEAQQRNFYFDVYYKGKLIATDVRSREFDDEPTWWQTPSYRLKDGHRKPEFKADSSRFKLIGAIQQIKKTKIVTSNTEQGMQVTQVVSNNINDLIKMIGDVISSGEGGYDSYNTGTRGVKGGKVGHSYVRPPAGTVTGKTINQILSTEGLSGYDTNRLFATGKYQTIIGTLRDAKIALGLSGSELYTAELQEKIFRDFLFEKAGGGKLADYVKRGKGTVDDAMYAASKEWASIAAPNGLKTKSGNISDGTRAYHDDNANKENQKSTRELRLLLESIKLGANKSESLPTTRIQDDTTELVSGVQVLFNGVKPDRQAIVSQKTKNILAAMAKDAGMSKIYITSTLRTPEEQARAMYGTRIQYGALGRDVIAYGNQFAHLGKEVQIQKMVERIKYHWANSKGNVSNHCVSPEQYAVRNVVDIGLNSNGFGKLNALGKKFDQVFNTYKANGTIHAKSISGGATGEGAFHIEIAQ